MTRTPSVLGTVLTGLLVLAGLGLARQTWAAPPPRLPELSTVSPAAEASSMSELDDARARTLPLSLDDVLRSVVELDPRIEAADFEIEAAEAKLLAARGGFDTTVKARGSIQPLGYYRNGVIDVRFEQPTPLYGLTAWAGWRIGVGEFPVYDGKLLTAQGGELRAGVELPLWRDGGIDRTRADIRQARIEQERKGHSRDAKLLELEAKAAEAYWTWVAAGLRLDIERTLLELALDRDAGLRAQIELGSIEAIVGTDNRRAILSREGRVVAAEREFQKASLELSLYVRDAAGEPLLVGPDRLPSEMPQMLPPELTDIEAEVAAAIQRRPDLQALLDEREQAEVEQRFARNQRGARIDLGAWVAQDVGVAPVELQPFELVAAVEIEIPIPLRKARGQLQLARAELGRLGAELRLLENQIAVDVLDAHSAVTAAYQRALLAGEQVALAEALARAELDRFQLGAGDLLLVNLRELATADAASDAVEAVADYFIAKAQLEVATGQGVQPVGAR